MQVLERLESKVRIPETGEWARSDFVLYRDGKRFVIHALNADRPDPDETNFQASARSRKEADAIMGLLAGATTSGDPTRR